MAGHVFISHGSENVGEANALCAFIEERGVKAWIAPRDVRPGIDYSEELQAAIESCVAFVVLVTETANKSPYVRAETEMAFSNSKPIFPVRLSDIKPAAGLAFFLKIRHWTDAYGPGRDASLDRLGRELQTLCGVAPAPVPAPAPAPPAPAPVPPVPPPPPAPAPMDEELLAAAIGPKADYYLARWRKLDETRAKTSGNWAATFANLYWLAYRKMWLPLALFAVATIVLSVLGSASPLAGRLTLVATALLTCITGALGNIWYRSQTQKLVAGTAGMEREAALARLRAKGGVSKPAVFVAIGVTVLLLVVVVAGAVVQVRQQMRDEALRQQHLRAHEEATRNAVPTEEEPPAEEQPTMDDTSGL